MALVSARNKELGESDQLVKELLSETSAKDLGSPQNPAFVPCFGCIMAIAWASPPARPVPPTQRILDN